MQTLQNLCKVYYSFCSRIKDIDPIMHRFESVLPCNSSDALFHNQLAVVLELCCRQTYKSENSEERAKCSI